MVRKVLTAEEVVTVTDLPLQMKVRLTIGAKDVPGSVIWADLDYGESLELITALTEARWELLMDHT